MWQSWHFRHILKSDMLRCVTGAGCRTLFHPRGKRGAFCTSLNTWASVVRHEKCFWRPFCVAGAVFGVFTWTTFRKGRKKPLCEAVIEFDLGHDDGSAWQAQDFGCLGLIFRSRRSTL